MAKIKSVKKKRKYAGTEIENDIISKIHDGDLLPGDALLSTSVLAKHYGVSLVTAHQALSNLARENYVVRKNGSGTFVSETKKCFPFAKVGFMLFHHHNPFHLKLYEALSDYADTHNLRIVIGSGDELEFIAKMVERGVDRIIRYPYKKNREKLVWETLRKHDMKAVVINDFWLNGGELSCVNTDEEAGVLMMMEHLIGLGHERIVLMDETVGERRLGAFNGYCRSLMRHGIAFDDNLVSFIHDFGNYSVSDEMVENLMKKGTAALFTYDYYAIKFLEAMKRIGLKAGSDLAVAGFDDIPDAETMGLTTINQDVPALVENAFAMLSKNGGDKILIKPKLKKRASTIC